MLRLNEKIQSPSSSSSYSITPPSSSSPLQGKSCISNFEEGRIRQEFNTSKTTPKGTTTSKSNSNDYPDFPRRLLFPNDQPFCESGAYDSERYVKHVVFCSGFIVGLPFAYTLDINLINVRTNGFELKCFPTINLVGRRRLEEQRDSCGIFSPIGKVIRHHEFGLIYVPGKYRRETDEDMQYNDDLSKNLLAVKDITEWVSQAMQGTDSSSNALLDKENDNTQKTNKLSDLANIVSSPNCTPPDHEEFLKQIKLMQAIEKKLLMFIAVLVNKKPVPTSERKRIEQLKVTSKAFEDLDLGDKNRFVDVDFIRCHHFLIAYYSKKEDFPDWKWTDYYEWSEEEQEMLGLLDMLSK